MITIGGMADVGSNVPDEIMDEVLTIALMLDRCYGERDIFHDDGGFILMLMSGVSAKAAQERLGNADYSTTMNIYFHVLALVKHEAAM